MPFIRQLADVSAGCAAASSAISSQGRGAVPADAQSGDSVFAACLRLFYRYPLAIRRHYAEHRYGSLVLMNRAAGRARFFVLIMEWDDLFVIRPWDRRDGGRVAIRRDEPVPDDVREAIE